MGIFTQVLLQKVEEFKYLVDCKLQDVSCKWWNGKCIKRTVSEGDDLQKNLSKAVFVFTFVNINKHSMYFDYIYR